MSPNTSDSGSYGQRKVKNLSKAVQGHLAKAGVESAKLIREFRFDDDADMSTFEVGKPVDLAAFNDYSKIIVTSEKTKGKGFAGVIKRHGFSMQDATHGNSELPCTDQPVDVKSQDEFSLVRRWRVRWVQALHHKG